MHIESAPNPETMNQANCELCVSPGGEVLWDDGFARVVLVGDPDHLYKTGRPNIKRDATLFDRPSSLYLLYLDRGCQFTRMKAQVLTHF